MHPDKRIYFDPPVTEAEAYVARKAQKAKDVLDKIGRLIPGEILGAYGMGLAALPTFSGTVRPWVGVGWFVLGIAATGWYVGWRIERNFVRWKHVLVYMWAFALWAYALSGMTVLPWIYHSGVATLLLAATSFVFVIMKLPAKEVR